jgi:hypothetical protein
MRRFEFGPLGKKENGMRSSAANEVKGKPQKAMGKSKTESGMLNDPTLEGKDESKIGRIQNKSGGDTRPEKARRTITTA